MKVQTFASMLLASAALAGAAVYAQEPLGVADRAPAAGQILSLSRAQVVAELEGAKGAARLIFGGSEEAALAFDDGAPAREQMGADTAADHADGSDAFGDLDYKAAFSVTAASRG